MTCRAVEIPEAPGALATRMLLGLLLTLGPAALASAATGHGGEVNLVLPNLSDPSVVSFLGGMSGWTLLSYGLWVAVGGLVFGAVIYGQIQRLPVHRSMAEVSELIYETCKTYMITQGKFLLILEGFTAVIKMCIRDRPCTAPGSHR